jgi:YidC/Oxa1 family membrane protein insertase
MFTTLIVQPIFNLLVLIYALIPSHNFGVAIILFTIIVRLLMWPLVKKQLNHAKAMRELQPELKKIKAATKGDRQKESAMTMALYKEREINPFASLGIVLVQVPVLIGLYVGLKKVIDHPQEIINFSYSALHNLSWMQVVAADISKFDNTLFGIVDLTKPALGEGGIYWPAMVLVIGSAIAQYLQSKQLMPTDKDARSLRTILKEAGSGKNTDQQEVNAAVGRTTQFLIPAFVLLIGLHLEAALPLYWLTSSVIALIQQSIILKEDAKEADASVEVDESEKADSEKPKPRKKTQTKKRTAKKASNKRKKRR